MMKLGNTLPQIPVGKAVGGGLCPVNKGNQNNWI